MCAAASALTANKMATRSSSLLVCATKNVGCKLWMRISPRDSGVRTNTDKSATRFLAH
jgi:hypothetical protein